MNLGKNEQLQIPTQRELYQNHGVRIRATFVQHTKHEEKEARKFRKAGLPLIADRGKPADTRLRIPPLALLTCTRGKGTSLPIRLYLFLFRHGAARDYGISISEASLAAQLITSRPSSKDIRRIADNLKKLESFNLISIDRPNDAGKPNGIGANNIKLLKEDGSGEEYKPVTGKDTENIPEEEKGGERYFTIPEALWQDGLFEDERLKSSGFAFLLVLLQQSQWNEYIGRGSSVWLSGNQLSDRFQLTHSIQTRGCRELRTLGLVHIDKMPLTQQSTDHRFRNCYTLKGDCVLPRNRDST